MPKKEKGYVHLSVNHIPISTVEKLMAKIEREAKDKQMPKPKIAAYVRDMIERAAGGENA